jgi:[acyl-carrier-protein] S-malonyltransferase
LQAAGIDAELSLGHSLGEYNHLVHIGALAFADALRLVEARGEAYDNGPDGAMASVFPIELDDLSDVIDRASDEEWGTLEVAHLNSPTQHVISGERAAVDAALGLLNDRHLVETLVIEDRLPMHSSRFAPVARELRPILERAPWRKPYRAYQPNVEGRPIESPSADAIVDSLARQACRPVLWRMSIEQLVHRHRDLTFIEVGPRSLLYNLLQRNWLPNRRLKIDTSGDLRTNFAQLVDELTRSA